MLDKHALAVFADTVKLAVPAFGALVERAAPMLKNLGSLGGIGSAAGALGGAAIEGVQSYRRARDEFPNRHAATGHALIGALRGAGKGALVGGALGAGAGAFAKRDMSNLAARSDLVGAASRFGVRQVHGLTGMLRPEELEAVRGGAYDARQAFQKAILKNTDGATALHAFREARDARPLSSQPLHVELYQRTRDALLDRANTSAQTAFKDPDVMRAQKAFRAAHEAQNLGLTSIPGYLRAAGDKSIGLRKAVGTSVKHTITSQPNALTALAVVPPAAGFGTAILSKSETDDRGRGRAERALGNAADVAGGIVTGAMPFGAGQLAAAGLHGAGGLAGRGIDRLRAAVPRRGTPTSPPPPEGSPGVHVPAEHQTSARAAGQRSEFGS